MKGRKIKPKVLELSLAYNPATRKKFFMSKEDSMEELMKLLKDEKLLLKEKDLDKLFTELSKTKEIPEDKILAVKGALRLLNASKDDLPESFLSILAEKIPSYGIFVQPGESPEDRRAWEKQIFEDARKSIEKDLKKLEPKKGDPNPEVYKELKTEIEVLRKDVETAKDEAQKEKVSRRILEIEVSLEKDNVPGDRAKMAKVLQTLEVTDPESAKDLREQLTLTGTALNAAGLLTEIGGLGHDTIKTPYAKLAKKVQEIITKDSAVTSAVAWKRVIRENPELYKEHLNAHKM